MKERTVVIATRVPVSLQKLLADHLLKSKYMNPSEFIRETLREKLVKKIQ